jgi:hypothetical protein
MMPGGRPGEKVREKLIWKAHLKSSLVRIIWKAYGKSP